MKKKDVPMVLRRKGITKVFLAEQLQMTRQGLEYHLNGDGEVKEFIVKKIMELAGSNGGWGDEENAMLADGYFFPLIDALRIKPGNLEELMHSGSKPQFFQYHRNENCFAVTMHGNSMEYEGKRSISEGDMLLIDMNLQVMSGDIVFAVMKNGRKFIRLYIENANGEITLKPQNPSFTGHTVKKDEFEYLFRVCKARGRDREM